jgi:hypothetical protein
MEWVPGMPWSEYESYPLPFAPTEAQLRAAPPPTPWVRRLFGLDADGVRRVLTEDAKSIRDPSVARFRDAVLKFEPVALTHDKEHWSLAMHRERSDCIDTIYIESPQDPALLETIFSKFAFAERELVEEFYRHFYGVSGSPLEECPSGFVRPEKWVLFESFGWEEQIKRYDPGRKWAQSLVIYGTGGGESILLDPVQGDTAWAVLAISEDKPSILPFTSSFAAVLDMCVEAAERQYLALDFWDWDRQRRS